MSERATGRLLATRADRIMAVRGLDETYENYAAALVEAQRELDEEEQATPDDPVVGERYADGTGRAATGELLDAVTVLRADVKRMTPEQRGYVLDAQAKGLLMRAGKQTYTADEYIAAIGQAERLLGIEAR